MTPDEQPGGSGTVSGDTTEKRQAGSYGRDAEQDPSEAPATDRDDVPGPSDSGTFGAAGLRRHADQVDDASLDAKRRNPGA
jgi:hypothetical protein